MRVFEYCNWSGKYPVLFCCVGSSKGIVGGVLLKVGEV